MRSYLIITNNSEKTVEDLLLKVLPIDEEKEQLIIFDNLSTDNTVPIIVSTVGLNFIDEENYKFYINKKKEKIKDIVEKAKKIAKGKIIRVNNKFKR